MNFFSFAAAAVDASSFSFSPRIRFPCSIEISLLHALDYLNHMQTIDGATKNYVIHECWGSARSTMEWMEWAKRKISFGTKCKRTLRQLLFIDFVVIFFLLSCTFRRRFGWQMNLNASIRKWQIDRNSIDRKSECVYFDKGWFGDAHFSVSKTSFFCLSDWKAKLFFFPFAVHWWLKRNTQIFIMEYEI